MNSSINLYAAGLTDEIVLLNPKEIEEIEGFLDSIRVEEEYVVSNFFNKNRLAKILYHLSKHPNDIGDELIETLKNVVLEGVRLINEQLKNLNDLNVLLEERKPKSTTFKLLSEDLISSLLLLNHYKNESKDEDIFVIYSENLNNVFDDFDINEFIFEINSLIKVLMKIDSSFLELKEVKIYAFLMDYLFENDYFTKNNIKYDKDFDEYNALMFLTKYNLYSNKESIFNKMENYINLNEQYNFYYHALDKTKYEEDYSTFLKKLNENYFLNFDLLKNNPSNLSLESEEFLHHLTPWQLKVFFKTFNIVRYKEIEKKFDYVEKDILENIISYFKFL